MSFTFLFITKGRKNFGKSLNKCLNLSAKFDYVKTLIIDGNNDNRVESYIAKNFQSNNVKIIKQNKGGQK